MKHQSAARLFTSWSPAPGTKPPLSPNPIGLVLDPAEALMPLHDVDLSALITVKRSNELLAVRHFERVEAPAWHVHFLTNRLADPE